MTSALTVTLKATYPCHGARRVRLPATQFVPVQVFERRCPHCGQAWTITQKLLAERDGVRVDKLDWEQTK